MTSKLFHTVVGVGISLGAMSIGCAAEPGSDSSSNAAADTTQSTDQTQPAYGNDQDRYCNVAWPTTKRGGAVAPAQACIDPKKECGDYPGGATFSRVWCSPVNTDGTCVADPSDRNQLWQICKDTSSGPQWECPSGTTLTYSCPAPPDNSSSSGSTTTTASNQAQN